MIWTKKEIIALSIVGAFVCAILIGVIVIAAVSNSKNDNSEPIEQLSYWQSMIKDETLIKQTVIPGAHDAGTKGLPYFAATQDRDTADLLKCGTRYFDLRVAYDNGNYKIYHGPSKGAALQSVLDAVKAFIAENASETVILDFQHFDGDAQQGTIQLVEKTLTNLLVVNDTDKNDVDFINELTLGQTRGKCLVTWGRETEEILAKKYVFKRNNDDGTRENAVIQSYYKTSLNTKSSARYVNTALPQYIEAYKQENSGLFVLQGQLTDGMYIRGPKYREATHTDNMNDYVRKLGGSSDLNVINIIMRDFVSPYKNCFAIHLNFLKGNVSADYDEAFKQMILTINPSLYSIQNV